MIDIYLSRVYCNSYILYNENKEGILIDPGYNENNSLIEHINKLGVNIKAILITHCHYDHITALKDIINIFPKAITYISNDEIDNLSNPNVNLSIGGNLLQFVPKKLVTLDDYECFESCGYKIQMIKTPFHTSGSCCYYVESEYALFSGDTLFFATVGRTDLPTGAKRMMDNSLTKLKKLPFETKVYPGHGVKTSIEREATYNSYLRNL